MLSGPGIAMARDEHSPLTTDPLCNLGTPSGDSGIQLLPMMASGECFILFTHNYYCIYVSLIFRYSSASLPAVAEATKSSASIWTFGTGKTTALRCAMGMLGENETRLYCSITKEKRIDLCCQSTLLIGVDDPVSKGNISNLIVALYNGASVGTHSQGDNE